jgi:hypothetical protein
MVLFLQTQMQISNMTLITQRNKFLVSIFLLLTVWMFLPAKINAQKSKARGQYVSLQRALLTPGQENGFDFEKVKFKHQFVTCEGKVQVGVAYDKKATFTQLWKNGKAYKKSEVSSKEWPKAEDIRIDDVTADLYFGSRKLGTVELLYIPEAYQGCSGKMFDVLGMAGINPKESVYKTNINKLFLRNIRVTRSSLKDSQ